MKYMIVIFFLSIVFSVHAQTKYDPYDSAAIMQNRKWEKKAMKKTDRALMYDVGFFYERLYRKYKDTSMNAAIRNYKNSAFAEGPLQETESYLSAKRLADIYSQGIGTKRDPEQALIYYYISWFEGADSLEALKKRMAGTDFVEYGKAGSDSIVISFHPLLKIESDASKKAIASFAKKLQNNPDYAYKLDVILPSERTTAIYGYYMRQDLPRKVESMVFDMLGPAISYDRRIQNQHYYEETGRGTRAKLILVIKKIRPSGPIM